VVDGTYTQGDRARFRLVAIIASAVCALVVIGQLGLVTVGVGAVAGLSAERGGALPSATQWLMDAQSSGLLFWLTLVFDVGVFALMYLLARRIWIGLLFAPVAIYFAGMQLLVIMLALPFCQMVG